MIVRNIISYLCRSNTVDNSNDDDDEDKLDSDIWLKKSLNRSEKSDADYIPDDKNESIIIRIPKSKDFSSDRLFMVYESCLRPLLSLCRRCGKPVIDFKEVSSTGSQYKVRMECIDGCDTIWTSQPSLPSVTGKIN